MYHYHLWQRKLREGRKGVDRGREGGRKGKEEGEGEGEGRKGRRERSREGIMKILCKHTHAIIMKLRHTVIQ